MSVAKGKKQARDLHAVVRDLCTWMPETEELISHGSPSYKAAGRQFASFTINHHGDGRVALWLVAPPGAQELYVQAEPEHYFVPPYVGPKGWLGVNLNTGLTWQRVAEHAREAYCHVTPQRLHSALGKTPEIKPPEQDLDPYEIDPLARPDRAEVLSRLSDLCLALPETSTAQQFGNPAWKAGKKTFVTAYHSDGRLRLSFWVGGERQSMLADDPRYRVPAYTGPNGWIDLDAEHGINDDEVQGLVLDSYRHFALKRMLKALEG